MITVKYTNNSTKHFNNLKDIFDDKQLDIIYLDCHYNQLKEIPVEIGNLINLQTFYCGDNQLKELTIEISNLIDLRIFYCDDNQLEKFPKEIGNLINLRTLYCINNQLKELPKEIGNLINLKEFYCYQNKLNELPIEIINCRNLRYFDYSNNEIIMNPIIQRFINRMKNIKNHKLYNDGQNVHTSSVQQSVQESIINLLKDIY